MRAVQRIVAILESFTAEKNSLTLQELADRIGLAKSTTFRIVQSLQRAGYLVRLQDQKYCLSFRLIRLAGLVNSTLSIREIARPITTQLADATKETVSIQTVSVLEAYSTRRARRRRIIRPRPRTSPTSGRPPTSRPSACSMRSPIAAAFSTSALAQTKWDMPTPYGDSFFHTQNNRQFAEDIKKASGGQIELVVHSNQSLLKHVDILRGVQTGQVPIGEILLSQFGNEDPVFAADNVPFLATSYAEARKLAAAQKPALEAVLAKGKGNLLARAVSSTKPRSLTKMSTAESGV